MSLLANGASISGLVLWLAGSLFGGQWARLWGAGLVTLAYVASLAIDLAAGRGLGAVFDVVFGIIWARIWLSEWKRKRRDPAARTLGAKSRARLAALVQRAREAAQPRRVLRPAPGGAS